MNFSLRKNIFVFVLKDRKSCKKASETFVSQNQWNHRVVQDDTALHTVRYLVKPYVSSLMKKKIIIIIHTCCFR